MTYKSNRLQELVDRSEARKTARAVTALPLFLELYKTMLQNGMSELCQCTRVYMAHGIPHCPNCGTFNNYAITTGGGVRTLPNGDQCVARGFKCRRCGLPFTDADTFLHCESAVPAPLMKEVRAKEKAESAIQKAGFSGVDDFTRRLAEFRKNKEE